jgi:hypothetical protein
MPRVQPSGYAKRDPCASRDARIARVSRPNRVCAPHSRFKIEAVAKGDPPPVLLAAARAAPPTARPCGAPPRAPDRRGAPPALPRSGSAPARPNDTVAARLSAAWRAIRTTPRNRPGHSLSPSAVSARPRADPLARKPAWLSGISRSHDPASSREFGASVGGTTAFLANAYLCVSSNRSGC